MINLKVIDDNTVELDMVGEVTGEDYRAVKPKLEKLFSEKGKMKFLMDLTRVKGFSGGAMYEDIKFDLQHFKFIGATAVVAQKKTYEMMTKFLNTFYPEKVHHFEVHGPAQNWLSQQAV